jgi:phage regulator Rha-like protein
MMRHDSNSRFVSSIKAAKLLGKKHTEVKRLIESGALQAVDEVVTGLWRLERLVVDRYKKEK